MEGLWLQRLRARWTRRTGKRTACATSASPAPPNEGGEGMSRPPTSRSDVRQECTAGWPKRRESHGHGAIVVVGDGENPLHGEGWQADDIERQRVREAYRPAPSGCRQLESCLRSKDSRAVVCPAKAGVFSRRETYQGKSQSPVARRAGGRETNLLKPLDSLIYGMRASFQAVAQANAQVAPKVSNPRGRACN